MYKKFQAEMEHNESAQRVRLNTKKPIEREWQNSIHESQRRASVQGSTSFREARAAQEVEEVGSKGKGPVAESNPPTRTWPDSAPPSPNAARSSPCMVELEHLLSVPSELRSPAVLPGKRDSRLHRRPEFVIHPQSKIHPNGSSEALP